MSKKIREIRRCARLLIPDVCANWDTIQKVKAESFTDVGINISASDTKELTGQGYTIAEGKNLADMAFKAGLGVVAMTNYMTLQEPLIRKDPSRAMISSSGKPTAFICPFQPKNREMYMSLLKTIIQWPAVCCIHMNDEASLSTWSNEQGCYCYHCTEVYKKETGEEPPDKDETDTDKLDRWATHRLNNWTETHKSFKDELKAIRPEVEIGTQHHWMPAAFGRNPRVSAVDLGRDAKALDFLSTDPYHFYYPGNIFKRCAPYRRIVTESTRSLFGATLKRNAHIFLQAFAPPLLGYDLTRKDGLLGGVVPFAMGADMIVPYSYELSKIIPGLFEAYQDTLSLTPLFEETQPWHYITVLASMQTAIYGHPADKWCKENNQAWMEVLYHAGMAWRWFYDARLDDAADMINNVLIVPDAHCLTAAQLETIDNYVKNGGGVLWVGRSPTEPWPENKYYPSRIETYPGCMEFHPSGKHPATTEIELPVMLEAVAKPHGFEGETLGTINGAPALVARQKGKGREMWLAGRPVFSYIKPGNNDQHRTHTDGIKMLRSIMRWLAGRKPLIELTPYPPPNAYGTLRPWDARDVPTMELFPMQGEKKLVGIVFHYMQLAYKTNIVFNLPENTAQSSIKAMDIYNNESFDGRYEYDTKTGRLQIPLDIDNEKEMLIISVEWQ